jgi:aquaporin Z
VIRRLTAEFIGTFWLVLGGCGTAVVAGGSVGTLGVSLAFGLALITGIYTVGQASGGHFNPAVSFGLWVGGRFQGKDLALYVVAQTLGATLAAFALFHIAQGGDAGLAFDYPEPGVLATNGYGPLSPQGYSLLSAVLTEVVLTAMFLFLIMSVTRRQGTKETAPLIIGLMLALIHMASIPITNTSVNPARSTGVALFIGGGALSQLWLFWVAPLLGGGLGGALYRWMNGDRFSHA